jgi:hypothetical protein
LPDDDEGAEGTEPGVRELEEIARPDVGLVVPEKDLPGLTVVASRADGSHVLLDRPLARGAVNSR